MANTIGQHRAKKAHEYINNLNDNVFEKYKPLVKGFPAMIINNGLGQAVLFLRSKNDNHHENHHEELYNHLNKWLKDEKHLIQNNSKLIDTILNEDSETYSLLTEETLQFLNWLRKFADAR